MDINEVHLCIEAFYDSIPLLETSVLKSLSLLNNEWWAATHDELNNRRISRLQDYFPNVKNGCVVMKSTGDLHIDDTCICCNAFLRIGRLFKLLTNRLPYSKHPSYDCLYADDLFDCNIDNDPNAEIKFINTMFFVFACGNSREDPALLTKQQILCNVCIAFTVLRYIFLATEFQYSNRVFKINSIRFAIGEKIRQLNEYTKKHYLPKAFKEQIVTLMHDLRSIGF